MRNTLRPRGFALLVVMALATAMVLVASSLTMTSGFQEVASVHAQGAELARLNAESGLARADAWAIQTLKVNGIIDFDRVLDPNLEAVCTGLGSAPFSPSTTGTGPRAGASTFLPAFSEAAASVVEFPAGSGQRWRRVALNRGAYLVRYEDNSDDAVGSVSAWATRTGNNPGTTNCDEGTGQGDNPARDRDGAIWAHVMGIYPGTNPATAKHRILLRKMIRLPENSPGQPAFSVGGNVAGDVGSNVSAENNFGGLIIRGNVTSTEKFCGRVLATGTSAATANSACSPTPNPFSNQPGTALNARAVPSAKDKRWYDWTTSCNFYVDPNQGLFYWDSKAVRGSGSGKPCSDYAGDLKAPKQEVDVDDEGHCWTPIILRSNITAPSVPNNQMMLAYQPFESAASSEQVDRRADGCTAFQPRSQTSFTYTDPGTGYTQGAFTNITPPAPATAYPVFSSYFKKQGTASMPTSHFTVAIPDWAAECPRAGSASELKWPTSLPTATSPLRNQNNASFSRDQMKCSSCNGTKSSLVVCPVDAGLGFTADNMLRFATDFDSYVAGVVFKQGGWVGVGGMGSPAPSDTSAHRTKWPMITFVVEGNAGLDVNDRYWFGVGTRQGAVDFGVPNELGGFALDSFLAFPSFVVGGDLNASDASGNASLHTLGGLYVAGKVVMKKKLVMFGPVAVGGGIEGSNGGSVLWDYDHDFFGTGSPYSAGPEPIATFPVGF